MKKNQHSGFNTLKFLCTSFLFAGSLLIGGQLKGQVSNMAFQKISGSYTAIAGGTVIGTGLDDDNTYGAQNIGFNFSYNGTVYTQFGLNTNGWISLGAAVPSNSYSPLSTGSTNNVIAGFGCNLNLGYLTTGNTSLGSTSITGVASTSGVTVGAPISGTGIQAGATVTAVAANTITLSSIATATNTGITLTVNNGETRVQTIGVAPNRVCVIQWSRAKPFATFNNNFNFQIRLSETSNNIDIIYGTMFTLTNTLTAQIGLRGSSNADFNNRNTDANWNLTTLGGSNASTCTVTPSIFPAVGTDFNWLQMATDLAITGIFAPAPGTTCLHHETISVTLKNTGLQPINFANNPVFISSSSTGLNPQTFAVVTINNGILAPGATQNNIVANNFFMDTVGLYTFLGAISMVGDGVSQNNTMPTASYISSTPTVNAGSDVTICEGTSTNLNATANAMSNKNYTYTSNQVVNVPDANPGGITTTLSCVGAPGNANQVKMVNIIGFTHTSMADMRFRLIAPNGSSVILINQRGGGGDNMTNTVFDPTSLTAISAGLPPFSSSFLPEAPLSGLTGVATGTWILEMVDNTASNVGTLNSWSLSFTGPNSIVSYLWSPAIGINNINVANPIANPIVTTDYIVTATDLNGCGNTDTVRVTVNPLPGVPASINGFVSVCEGQSSVRYITSSTDAIGYNWTVPSGASIAGNINNDTIYVTYGLGSVSGNITVTATNACGSSPSNTTLAITVNPLPLNAGPISGTTAVCEGSTGVMYSVPAIANTTNYMWTVPAGASIVGNANNDTIFVDFSVGASNGNIVVTGNNSCGNGGASTFAIIVNRIYTTNQTATICQNDSVFLAGAYQKISGTYNEILMTVNGCDSTIVTVLTVNPLPTVTLSNTNPVCIDSSAFALTNGTPAGGTYSGTGVNNGQFDPAIAGVGTHTITYSYTDANTGCSNSATNTIEVNPLPPTPTIAANGTTFTSTAASGNQWYLNGNPINGATNQTYICSSNGDYVVCVTDSNTCKSCSAILTFTTFGINENQKGYELNVYPNPTKDVIQVQLNAGIASQLEVRIMDVTGRAIYNESVKSFNGQYTKTIDLSSQSNGIYSLQFITDKGVITRKVILD